jgi:hypothetical protein
MPDYHIDLEGYTVHAAIDEKEARKALKMAYALAYRQWKYNGGSIALHEYQDAALTALTGCIARYDPKGKSFSSYAYQRMVGAVRDAPGAYRTWHFLRAKGPRELPHAWAVRPSQTDLDGQLDLARRIACLPVEARRYAEAHWRRETDRAFAQREHLSIPTLWKHRRTWRQNPPAPPVRTRLTLRRGPMFRVS